MRMHIGRKVTALGVAALVVGGAAGTALAASGGSSTAQTTASPVAAVTTADQQPALTKMTMAQLTAKLGKSEKQMVIALDDMKITVNGSGKLSTAAAENVMIKVLARDLGISASSRQSGHACTGGRRRRGRAHVDTQSPAP
jgi:hypothetical protein